LGFDVLIIDHRGQGRSGRLLADPHLGHVNRFNDYVDDLALEYEVIKDTPFDINDYTINLKELQLIDYIN